MNLLNETKRVVENTPASSLCRRVYQDIQIVTWTRNGRPVPPPHIIKQLELTRRADQFRINTLVETGTFLGTMVEALSNHFASIYTIEVDEALFQRARQKFARASNVKLLFGDSGTVLGDLMPQLDGPSLFWLDGHYSGGVTSMTSETTPILSELKHVAASGEGHVVIIDDARCFDGTSGYPTLDFLREYVSAKMPKHRITIGDDMISILPCQ